MTNSLTINPFTLNKADDATEENLNDACDLFQRLRDRKNPYLRQPAKAAQDDMRRRLPVAYAEEAKETLEGACKDFQNHNLLTLAAALAYADAGLSVVDGHALDSAGKPTTPTGEIKVPRGAAWQKRASNDSETIKTFWTADGRYPETKNGKTYPYARTSAHRNVNLTFPEGCGQFVLDIDGDQGLEELEKLEKELGALPRTWKSKTGSGGVHLIFKAHDLDIRNTASAIAPGVDIRGKNGQIVAAPSIHPSGNFYRWEDDCAPWECEVAEAPEWLLKRAYEATKGRAEQDEKIQRIAAKKTARGSTDRVSGLGFDGYLAAIGDGPDLHGFDAPIYSAALSYFGAGGDNEDEVIETLREAILIAPCKNKRNVTRYAQDDYLINRVEQAREYISEQHECESESDSADADTEKETDKTVSLNIAGPLGKKFSQALKTLASRWVVVNVGGKVMFVPRPDTDSVRGRVQFFSETEFIKFHKNRTIKKKDEQIQPAEVFAENAVRYAEMTFAPVPLVAMRHSFNLWNGYTVDRTARSGASCEKLKSFIKEVICGGRDDVFKWLWLWLAHCAQRPGEKPGTALVVQGGGGSGKSYFGTVLTRLFSPYSVFADRAEHVTGQFNSHLATAILMVSDEALFGGDPRVSGLIKSLVTTTVQRIEAKGVDSIEVPSFLRCVFIGNPKRVVPIEANGSDRRYLCLSVSDTYKDDTTYFAAIEAEIAAGGLEALFAELVAYDPVAEGLDWNMVRVAPETDEKKKMRRLSLPKVLRKLIEAVEDGALELRDESGRAIRYEFSETASTYVARDHLRVAVGKWADGRDGGQDANEVLQDLFGDDVTTTRRKVTFQTRLGYEANWDDDDRLRAHCYVLPSRTRMLGLIAEKFA